MSLSEQLLPLLVARLHFLEHHGHGTRPHRAFAEAKSKPPSAPASLSSQMHQLVLRENPSAKHRRPVADHAPEFSPVARAARDYVPAFSQNQFPDQTQSPWDQYRTLWPGNIVVEKNQPPQQSHLH